MSKRSDKDSELNAKFDYSSFQYFDFHTHFFPERMLIALWQYFEKNYWPIYSKNTPEMLAEALIEEYSVKKFVVLNYAHRKGIASSLNDWTYNFCTSQKIKKYIIPFGTIHASDDNLSCEIDRIFGEFGFAGLKLQLMVTDFYITDKRMEIVYQKILDYDKVLLVHIGTGPSYSNYYPQSRLQCPYVGVKYLIRFMKKYPEIKIVVPHLGAEEFEDMWKLIEIYPNLYFDTAMIGVKNNPAFDDNLKNIDNDKLYSISERILFGSDFPNIPYAFENSIFGWLERNMEGLFYKKLFFRNAQVLLKEYL